MKIGICGARLPNVELNTSIPYIGVDRGVEHVLQQSIFPVVAIGDFDSLVDMAILDGMQVEKLPTRKDITDTEHAIEWAIEQGYNEFEIYGVTGGRLDHFMAIVALIEKYRDYSITIIDNQNTIQLLKEGTYTFDQTNYTYFSVFALTESYIDLKECQYPLHQYHLVRSDPLCVSNQALENTAVICTTNDVIFIQSKD